MLSLNIVISDINMEETSIYCNLIETKSNESKTIKVIFFTIPCIESNVVDSRMYLFKTFSCFITIEEIIFLLDKKFKIGLHILKNKALIHLLFLFIFIKSFILNTSINSSNPDTIIFSLLS